jgi:FkbM family methyltransferase
MKGQAKAVLRASGLLEHAVGLRNFFRTITIPNRYDVDFASFVVSFLSDRPYTKQWFHRNRQSGAHKGWHEPSTTFLLESLAQDKSSFVDVGSHLGYFSILFSSITGNKSLAIELDPSNFEELKRAVAFQPAVIRDRIAIVHCGVSNVAGTIELPAKRALSPGRSICAAREIEGRRVTVEILTLDEVIRRHEFAPDIVKIDVEGFEFNALRGAANTISMFKPILILEVHPQHMCRIGHNPSMVSRFLRDRGYTMYAFNDHRSKDVSPCTEVHEITNMNNHVVVCVHENDRSVALLLPG